MLLKGRNGNASWSQRAGAAAAKLIVRYKVTRKPDARGSDSAFPREQTLQRKLAATPHARFCFWLSLNSGYYTRL
jgi:hypothetical protein